MEPKYKIAIELIKKYEGFSRTAYRCPAGVKTIGYGRITGSMESTTKEAEELWLLQKLRNINTTINRYVKPSQSPEQMAALMSFIYNVGETSFVNSTLLKCINSSSAGSEIDRQFKRWNKAGKSVLLGLTKRRTEEAKLYNCAN
jgi:lysozyme